jgi:hypothetical protein
MLIPGFLISLLTFPGVIVHEIAHRLAADLVKVPVYAVCYFRVGNPAGYVVHGPVTGLRPAFLISVMPFVANTVLCALITFSAVFPLFILHEEGPIVLLFVFIAWVGISIGMHAFPSKDDMDNLVQQVSSHGRGGPAFQVARVFSLVFRLANLLSFFWFDAIYAVGVSLLLPWLFGFL